MEDILKPNYVYNSRKEKQEYPVTQLLIEGAPGMGKSTFAWEVCQKWGQHQLFNEYSLVVLLKFRDKRTHKTKNVSGLFYYPNTKLWTEIIDYITTTGGHWFYCYLRDLMRLPAQNEQWIPFLLGCLRDKNFPRLL